MTGNFRALPPQHGWVHGADLELLLTALISAGARRVGAQTFSTLGANCAMGRPFTNRDFAVWEWPNREARPGGRHDLRLHVRFGEECTGGWSQRIYEFSSSPPGFRKAESGGVRDAFRSKGQVGYPPSVVPDANLGLSVVANQ